MLSKYNRQFLNIDVLLCLNKEAFMLDQQKEAFYHFTLSDMVDLIRQYGYSRVMNDLDSMIADEVNRLTEMQR
jgi:hypothetical protein